MTLRSVLTDVYRSPLVISTLRTIVQELHLVQALFIVLILCSLLEVVTIVLHQLVRTILLITTFTAIQNILKNS